MRTSSQDCVRALFSLPPQEKVYDDFGCALRHSILYHGRLFLTQHYICFNSNILGFINKCVIPISEITNISKKRTLGIFNNAIEIKIANQYKNDSYTFVSFAQRDIAYKRIKMVCNSAFSEKSLKTDQASTQSNDLCKPKFSDSEESGDDSEKDGVIQNNRSATFSELNYSVLNNDIELLHEEPFFPAIDPEKIFEGCKVVINIPPQEFYEKFVKDSAEHSLETFFIQEMEHSNVTVTEWKEVDSNVFTRDFTLTAKVKDVPFVTQSRVNKVQKLTRDGDKILLSGSTSSLDVPYCTYFTIEDTWEIFPFEKDKSILRTYVFPNFVKSTMFKSTIVKATKAEFQKEIDKWISFAKTKGYVIDNYIPPKKKRMKEEEVLLHGIEKEKILVNIPKFFKYFYNAKNWIREFYVKSKKDFYISLALIILFLSVAYLIILVHRQSKLIENNNITIHQLTGMIGNFIYEKNHKCTIEPLLDL